MNNPQRQGTLRLNSGEVFNGTIIGSPMTTSGELVFTTGMVGYSEAITDPSYFGQILVFSYPLIGNYGIPQSPTDTIELLQRGFESTRAQTAGVVLAVDSPEAFHWSSFLSIHKWLEEQNIPGIAGIDTRHLVHHIRSHANCFARIEPSDSEGYTKSFGLDSATAKGGFFDPSEVDILPHVSTNKILSVGTEGKTTIAVLDCGVKWNIIRQLRAQNCKVLVVPWNTPPETVACDGWLISNGPGDPKKSKTVVQSVKTILGLGKPVLGICLGHQLLALACGADTTKMTYGHRSHNQPVMLEGTRKGFITSQNHGYEVLENSLPKDWQVWFRNANDKTVEGIKHSKLPLSSVQFHPEAAGGPRDTSWIIKDFVRSCC